MKSAYVEISLLLQAYFEGLHQCDLAILQDIFHADMRYINTVEDDYMNYSVSEYLSIIRHRQSPASQGETMSGQINAIHICDTHIAFAQVTMTMLQRHYVDYLTLIWQDSQAKWKIISKVFHYSPITVTQERI